jgi:hypothetical protein
MDIVQRAKNICLSPESEWQAIAVEATPTSDLIAGYVIPLAAIGAVAGFVGGSLIGRSLGFLGYYRVPLVAGVETLVFTLVMAVVGVFILSLIVNALAPTFGGEKNSAQALKVVAYSYTPAWVAGILLMLPALGILTLLAGFYGLYLLYLGLPRLMKAPPDKAIAYTAVSVVCAIVLTVVIGAIGSAFVGAGLMGAGALGAPRTSSTDNVQFDKNSALGKLQDLGAKLEENNKKVDAAQKAGDQTGAAAAALSGLGILAGGGKHYDPIGIDVLKPLVPDQFAGLPKASSSAEKNGFAGLAVSTAKATYSDGGNKHVTLEITDSGGASGLVSLAGWAGGIQSEKEDDSSVERTAKVNGRLMHEKSSKVGGTNEYSIVLGDRFVVTVQGTGVDVAQLKGAVATLDLNKLESMKDVGAQQ